jgi:hypothetical protein
MGGSPLLKDAAVAERTDVTEHMLEDGALVHRPTMLYGCWFNEMWLNPDKYQHLSSLLLRDSLPSSIESLACVTMGGSKDLFTAVLRLFMMGSCTPEKFSGLVLATCWASHLGRKEIESLLVTATDTLPESDSMKVHSRISQVRDLIELEPTLVILHDHRSGVHNLGFGLNSVVFDTVDWVRPYGDDCIHRLKPTAASSEPYASLCTIDCNIKTDTFSTERKYHRVHICGPVYALVCDPLFNEKLWGSIDNCLQPGGTVTFDYAREFHRTRDGNVILRKLNDLCINSKYTLKITNGGAFEFLKLRG